MYTGKLGKSKPYKLRGGLLKQWDQNSDPKIRAKITSIGIKNPKLIVTNDYQQFLAHFEWFLALFHIVI